MSLLKKLKKAYNAGRDLSEQEQSVLERYRLDGVISVERGLERLAYQKRSMSERMKNSTILGRSSFYLGKIIPYIMYAKLK